MLSGGDALRTTAGEGPNEDNIQKLRPEELSWMVQAALARWAEADLSAEDLARLRGVTFEIARLPEGVIASAEAARIKISETAAGYGWFIDQTPQEDSEFLVPVAGRELQTTEYSIAHGKVDLLTVLMRELGMIYLQDQKRVPKALRPPMCISANSAMRERRAHPISTLSPRATKANCPKTSGFRSACRRRLPWSVRWCFLKRNPRSKRRTRRRWSLKSQRWPTTSHITISAFNGICATRW